MRSFTRRYLVTAIAAGLMTLAVIAIAVVLRQRGVLGTGATAAVLIGALLVSVAVTITLVWQLGRRVDHAVTGIASALEKVAEGDLDAPPDLPCGEKSLARLAGAVDAMRTRLLASTASRDYLDRLLSGMNEAILVTDVDGRIYKVNNAACALLGYSGSGLTGLGISDLLVDTRDLQQSRSGDAGDTRARPRDAMFRHSDGSEVPVSYTVSVIRDTSGGVESHVYAAQNITDRKRIEQRMRYLARIDPLTRLANRMQFQHLLQQGTANARRQREYLALIYFDVDRFKDINDTFGHAAGDSSLEVFAARVSEEIPAGAVAGRLAGDEFAVMVSGFTDIDTMVTDVTDIANRLLAAVGKPFKVHGEEIFMSTSMGVALYPRDGDNSIDLLRNADAALYHAKRAGGNCVEFYTSDMNNAAVERLMLKSKLRRAFERDELLMHYQPKYSVDTGRIAGAEALIRWDLPERGLVFPADFIPLAEETNLILQVGEWVLNRVCADYRFWQRSLPSPGRVSLNLSLRQLHQQRFLERVDATFRAHGVSPTCLEFEITETTLMDDAERTIRILDSLYAMGLHLAIDDFGTGYSSLSALQQFPISTLKIDQSFVRDVAVDHDDAAIVSTIIRMAHSLKLEVVGEGVESREQLEFLREHGCDYVQGRLFADPMTREEYRDLLLAEQFGTNRHPALSA
jgi:diguanylate cyclase (GGDEF)-like protein/PAS domain S-box-containing protein